MQVIKTCIAGFVIPELRVFGEDRGFSMETWSQQLFADIGIDCDFVQNDHSCLARGLHDRRPNP